MAKIPSRKNKKLRERLLRNVDNTRDIESIVRHNKLIYEILGISKERLEDLFEKAFSYLENYAYEEAEASFSFLTKVNPFIPDFWLGLGLVYEMKEEYEQALTVCLVAITMDPLCMEAYWAAIDCCLEMKDIRQAEALLKQAVQYAKKHKKEESALTILQEAEKVQQVINEMKI